MGDHVQDNITAYWHGHGQAYDAHPMSQVHMGPARDAWAAIWSRALPDPPADILDVGTGTGQVSVLLAELGHRVTGTDLAEGMLDLARAKAAGMANPPTLLVGDAVHPDLPDAAFDVVTNRYLLWTLREPRVALASWQRVLRPGGRLVIVDATWHDEGLPTEEDGDRAEMARHYDEAVRTALPLAGARSIDDTVEVVRRSGYVDVTVTPLPEILELERALLPEPHDSLRLQHLIAGRRPG